MQHIIWEREREREREKQQSAKICGHVKEELHQWEFKEL